MVLKADVRAKLTKLAKKSDGGRPELKRAKDYLAQR
jgi:hypothetical protein